MNNTQVHDAYDDVVMPMYNLIKYSNKYSKTSGILKQYCRDKPTLDDASDNISHFNANNATTNPFKVKETITGKAGNSGTKDD